MVISGELLKQARAAGAGIENAEQELQALRAEYRALVRRMHLAGGSLREIAQALGLSHQRVQQMVREAGGSWWQNLWRHRNMKGRLSCTFCRRPQSEVAKLIAGPKVFICDACVEAVPAAMGVAREGSRAKCSFCGKQRTSDRQLFTGPAGNMCSECLSICRQILIDSGDSVVHQ